MNDSIWLIAGLGNPGREYVGTRHNTGFETLDEVIDEHNIDGPKRFGKSLIGRGTIAGEKVICMKPQTYMNLSGEAIREAVDYFKIDSRTHLIVLLDDIDQEPGHLRIRAHGSGGGHNGLKNIVQQLGGDEHFIRIRIGVGAKPNPHYDLADWVLSRPQGEAAQQIADARKRAAEAVEVIIRDGVEKAMNLFN